MADEFSSQLPPAPHRDQRRARRAASARESADKSRRIKSLKCYPEVHDMVCRGWAARDIAVAIQQKHLECLDMELGTLTWAVQRYRKSLPTAVLLQQTLPTDFRKAAERLESGVNVVEELTKLYRFQMGRLEMEHELERQASKLLPSMTNEVKEARALLESLHQAQQDLGINDQTAKQLEEEGAVAGCYSNAMVQRVLSNPDSRRKLLGLTERLVQITEARAELDGFDASEGGSSARDGDTLFDLEPEIGEEEMIPASE